MAGLVLYGVASLVRLSDAVAGREITRWLPRRDERTRLIPFLFAGGLGVTISVVVLLLVSDPIVQARLAVGGIGTFLIVLACLRGAALRRAPSLREAPNVRLWFESVWDRLVMFGFLAVGIGVIVWAFTARLE
jgi:hypothetical protein